MGKACLAICARLHRYSRFDARNAAHGVAFSRPGPRKEAIVKVSRDEVIGCQCPSITSCRLGTIPRP